MIRPQAPESTESAPRPVSLTDRALIARFAKVRDQAAFRELVERHGAMVYGVCHAILKYREDAEDAFQATFLVLAQSARRVRWKRSLANWLHGVARRVSLKAATRRARMRRRELAKATATAGDPGGKAADSEVESLVHAELARLPDRYRSAVILCDLEGRSREDAAMELNCSVGAIKGRLERGRQQLRARLAAQGLTRAGAVLPVLVDSSLPTELVESCLHTVSTSMTGASAGSASHVVVELTRGEILMARWMMTAVISTVLAVCVAVPVVIAQLADPAPAADRAVDEETLALLSRLPSDGSWVRYKVETALGGDADGDGRTIGWSIASVGETQLDGKPARWLEVKADAVIAKALFPVKAFEAKDPPGRQIVRGWLRVGGQPVQAFDGPGPAGEIFQLALPGWLAEPKSIAPMEVDAPKLGKVRVSGVEGRIRVADPKVGEATYRAWLHPSIPFGTVAAELSFGAPVRGTMKLTLVDFGKDAKSSLPDNK